MSALIGEESVHALQQDIEDDDTTALPSPSSVATPTTTNPLNDNNNVDTADNYRLVEGKDTIIASSSYCCQCDKFMKRTNQTVHSIAFENHSKMNEINKCLLCFNGLHLEYYLNVDTFPD